jgi:hypothetical protein
MNSIKQKDMRTGLTSETNTKPILEKFFNKTIIKSTDKYAILDFHTEDKKIYYELKTRNIHKTQYRDIMIGYNKIVRGFELIEKGCEIYLIWKFTNGLCYYKLDKDTFKNEWVRQGGRNDRGFAEYSQCCYIPTDLLTEII